MRVIHKRTGEERVRVKKGPSTHDSGEWRSWNYKPEISLQWRLGLQKCWQINVFYFFFFYLLNLDFVSENVKNWDILV